MILDPIGEPSPGSQRMEAAAERAEQDKPLPEGVAAIGEEQQDKLSFG